MDASLTYVLSQEKEKLPELIEQVAGGKKW